ncbi:DEAD/DEAH box helicase [Candidatus Woesearchaeota archaeon]|nr:DEAD/DEAH box helicase [Candidatus Woesearchaeota archaeon]
MDLITLPLPDFFKQYYTKFKALTPIQEKAVNAGLLDNNSLLICAPTASGKTLVATMGLINQLEKGKGIYLVPLKALANEKYKEYKLLLQNTPYKITIATGDMDEPDLRLEKYDLLILTTEKLDALLRHKISWLSQIRTVVIDEIHLLHDTSRGPTLEVILTLLKTTIKPQLIGLSATIGNPEQLAKWLDATLVQDNWRPVELHQAINTPEQGTTFYKKEQSP